MDRATWTLTSCCSSQGHVGAEGNNSTFYRSSRILNKARSTSPRWLLSSNTAPRNNHIRRMDQPTPRKEAVVNL